MVKPIENRINTEATHVGSTLFSKSSGKGASHISTLASASSSSSSFLAIFLAPFTLLGRAFTAVGKFVQTYFLPFCKCFGVEKIDWVETKEHFEHIHNAITQDKKDRKDRAALFKKFHIKLSEAAEDRYKDHICFAKAKIEEEILDRAMQEQWTSKNKHKMMFEHDYFSDPINNVVLKEATINFWEEIKQKNS